MSRRRLAKELLVGPQLSADGGFLETRGGNTGEMLVVDAHGLYLLGTVYSSTWSLSSTTAVTYTAGSASNGCRSIWNPPGSNVIATIISISLGRNSVNTITQAETIVYGIFTKQKTVPSGGAEFNGVPCLFSSVSRPSYLGQIRLFSDSTLATNPTNPPNLSPAFIISANAAATATYAAIPAKDSINGLIAIPPGCLLTLATANLSLGTSAFHMCNVLWKEVPLSSLQGS